MESMLPDVENVCDGGSDRLVESVEDKSDIFDVVEVVLSKSTVDSLCPDGDLIAFLQKLVARFRIEAETRSERLWLASPSWSEILRLRRWLHQRLMQSRRTRDHKKSRSDGKTEESNERLNASEPSSSADVNGRSSREQVENPMESSSVVIPMIEIENRSDDRLRKRTNRPDYAAIEELVERSLGDIDGKEVVAQRRRKRKQPQKREPKFHLFTVRGISKHQKKICNFCKNSFPNVSTLARHVYSSHGPEAYAEIKDQLRFRKNLRIPIEIASFPCSICNKEFKNKDYLRSHQRVHTDLKQFMCEVCGRGFKLKHQVTSHVQRVHVEKKERFNCNYCPRSFTRDTTRDAHQYEHELKAFRLEKEKRVETLASAETTIQKPKKPTKTSSLLLQMLNEAQGVAERRYGLDPPVKTARHDRQLLRPLVPWESNDKHSKYSSKTIPDIERRGGGADFAESLTSESPYIAGAQEMLLHDENEFVLPRMLNLDAPTKEKDVVIYTRGQTPPPPAFAPGPAEPLLSPISLHLLPFDFNLSSSTASPPTTTAATAANQFSVRLLSSPVLGFDEPFGISAAQLLTSPDRLFRLNSNTSTPGTLHPL